MGFDDLCNTGLILGLGFSPSTTTTSNKRSPPQKLRRFSDEPSLTLSLSGDHDPRSAAAADGLFSQDSGGSSFSSSLKREREEVIEIPEQPDEDDNNVDDDDGSIGRKKKLRLSKAQSALLEESFMLHTTLNPKQKQELARHLKLRPRQVEVWFQNRRARTKLKQTEVDCEFLKKCCETLTEENRRLQKELKALKLGQPLCMQLPSATLTMCPSCERVIGGAAGSGSSPESVAKSAFLMAPKPHFLNPFTNSSAAC